MSAAKTKPTRVPSERVTTTRVTPRWPIRPALCRGYWREPQGADGTARTLQHASRPSSTSTPRGTVIRPSAKRSGGGSRHLAPLARTVAASKESARSQQVLLCEVCATGPRRPGNGIVTSEVREGTAGAASWPNMSQPRAYTARAAPWGLGSRGKFTTMRQPPARQASAEAEQTIPRRLWPLPRGPPVRAFSDHAKRSLHHVHIRPHER
jgi:hypothetical protein